MPEGEVRICNRADPFRVGRVVNVEEQSVPAAGAAGEADGGIQRDIVTLRRPGGRARLRRATAASAARRRAGRAASPAASPSAAARRRINWITVPRRRGQILEDAGRADDLRVFGRPHRNANDLDAETGRVRILIGSKRRAPRQLSRIANAGRPRDIDVDVRVILGVDEHRVSVRAATGLHIGDVLGARDVRDVEDADATDADRADRVGHALAATVLATRLGLGGYEEQVLVNRHVALGRGAVIGRLERRSSHIRDVPNLVAIVIALNRVFPQEGDVGVGDTDEALGRRTVRDQAQVPRRFGRARDNDPRIRRVDSTGRKPTRGSGLGGDVDMLGAGDGLDDTEGDVAQAAA